MAPPKVIYITSSMYSGSTLLDLCLGSHSKMVSLGEICNLSKAFGNGDICSCGAPLPECPFWEAVEQKLKRSCGHEVSLASWDLMPKDPERYSYANLELLKMGIQGVV